MNRQRSTWPPERERRHVICEQLERRLLFSGAPVPAVTLAIPPEEMINESFQFSVDFDNSSATPTDVGFAPFIDLHVPDAIDVSAATYLGSPVTLTLAGVFDGTGNLVDISTMLPVDHPLLGTPVAGGTPGDLLYVLELPFGSFVPDQPVARVELQATLNKADGAVVGVPLTVNAQGGFALGCDPLDNPGSDPPVLGTATSASITPTVLDLRKLSDAAEQERSSGPNFPVTYTLSLDVADGETVTNVDLVDLLPDSFVYRDDVSITVGPGVVVTGQSVTDTPVPFVTNLAPDNDFLIEFASIVGTAADNDVTVQYSIYVAEFDATAQRVIDATTGDDVLAVNDASATASYGIDVITDDDAATDFQLSQQSLSIQKGYSIVNDVGAAGPTPGDTVEYQLNLQVSDFFQFSNLVIDDVFSDGQRFDVAFTPTFEIVDNGTSTSGNFSPGNYTVTLNSPGDGSTDVHFDVSAEDADGLFVGDLYADAIQQGGTTIRVRYRTIIQEDFSDTFPSGDPSVDVGDILTNTVVTTAMLPSSQLESDGSGTSMAIEGPSIQKAAYAIDGAPILPGDRLVVGHTITYRLTLTMPAADSENLVLSDYLPLPIFNATQVITFDNSGPTATPPPAGVATYGPNHTLHTVVPSTDPPTLSIDPAANSIAFQFGSFDATPSVPATVDILFTVSALDVLMADDLALTNQVQATYGTTNSGQTQSAAIVQTVISAPDLQLTKGAVSSDAAAAVFSPATVGPLPFIAPGIAGAPFVGVINSGNLATDPIDSDLTGIDAGDLVKFALVIENRGSADAFDLSILDNLPVGFQIPTSPAGMNLEVRDGDGNAVSYLGPAAQLFTSGIEIVDGLGQGAINNYDEAQTAGDGSNILVITYDLEATGSVEPGMQLVNSGLIDRYGAIEGGNDHTAGSSTSTWEDTTTVTVRDVVPTKSIATTSEAHTTFVSGFERVAVGEIIRYRLVLELPEGTSPDLRLHDQLPDQLQFLDDGTATVAFVSDTNGITSSDVAGALNLGLGTAPAVLGNETNLSTIVPSFVLPDENVGSSNSLDMDPDGFAPGTDVFVKLGDVVNADGDANLEYIVVEMNALVLNAAAASNDQNDTISNSFQSTIDITAGPVQVTASNTVEAVVAEPLITNLNKVASPTTGDAGDVVSFTVTYSNSTDATRSAAFDARALDVLSPDLALDLASVNVVLGGGAAGVTDNSAANTLDVTLGVVPIGGSVTITYSATILGTATAGSVISDTVDLTYSSLPGPQGTVVNTTGSTTPGASGTDLGERNGSGGVNDYTDADSASVTVATPTVAKLLLNTSVVNGTNAVNQAVIGETAQYRVQIDVPEGITNDLIVIDTLDAGLTFVSLDSISAGGALSSSTVDLNDPATVTPVVSGTTISFALGNITNSDTNNAVDEVITLTYTVRVANVVGNQGIGAATLLDNTAVAQYDVAGNPQSTPSTSAATVEVIEPDLEVNVTAVPAVVDAGDTATFTIVVGHTVDSDTDAFDLSFSDLLPPDVVSAFPADFSIIHSALGDISASFEIAAGELRTIPGTTFDLLRGDTLTVTIQGTLSGTASAGQVISHNPQVDWSSLDGTIPSERDGSGGINDYTDTDTASVTVATPTVAKLLLNTSVVNGTNAVNQAVIGESAQYRVQIDVPEGITNDLIVIDTLDAGWTFVALDAISAGGALSSSTVDLNDPATVTPVVSGTTISFALGNITNSDTNNAVDEVITLTYTVRVANVVGNQGIGAATLLDNTAVAQYDVAGNPQSTPSTSAATVEVIEPDLEVNVTAVPAVVDAGDTATFTIVVGHTVDSDTDAFDLSFSDLLPPDVVSAFPADFSIIHSALGDISASFEVAAGELRTIPGTTFDLLKGDTLTVTIQGTLSGTASAGQVISHNPQVDWSSLDGTVAGERDGSGGVNDYTDTDTASVTVATPTVAKLLLNTSVVNGTNAANQAVIGETAQYQVEIDISEGVTNNLVLVDTLDAGWTFVSLDAISAGGALSSSTVDLNDPATVTPVVSGTTVSFALGNVTNSNTNNGIDEVITLTYTVRVANVAGNQGIGAATLLDNTAVAQYDVAGNPQSSPSASAATVEVIEPDLDVNVTVMPAVADADDTVTFTIVVGHTVDSDTDAFDVSFSDLLPPDVVSAFPADFSIMHSALGDISASFEVAAGELRTIPGTTFDLLRGDTLTVTIQGTLSGTVSAGQVISHNPQVDWSSLDGTIAGERDGSGGVNDYSRSGSGSLSVASAAIGKSLLSSSIVNLNNSATQVVIGETAQYVVTLTIPEGTMDATEVVDTLDAGLEFVQLDSIVPRSNGNPTMDISTDIGAGDFSDLINFQPTISGQTLTFNLGDLANANTDNSAAETIAITYTVRTRNVAGNQSEIPTMLDNSALVQWLWGVTPVQSGSANAAPLEVIEPELSATVTVDDSSPILGDVITYTVTLDHTAGSDGDAFDLEFTDTLAAGLTLDLASIQVFGAGVVADASVGNSVDLQLDQQLLGDTVTVEYQATVSSDPAVLGTNLVNGASLTWTSLTGPSPHERTGTGGVNDYSASDSVTVITVNPDLRLDKSDGQASVVPGQTYAYMLTVTNQGTEVATGIHVVDVLPIDRLQFVSTDDPGNVTYNAMTGQLDWTPGGTLGFTPGSNTIQLQVTVQVDNIVAAGMDQIVNSASVTHDDIEPTPGDNTGTDVNTLNAAPDYQITIDDGRGVVSTGDTVTYTITAQHVGNQDGTGVVITDTFPTSVLTNVTASLGGVVDTLAGTVTWNIGAFAAGDFVVVTVTGDVVDPVAAGINDLTSTANVTDDGLNGPDPTPGNNTDDDTDTLNAAPDYQITIDDAQTVTSPGSNLVYTLSAENVGEQDGTGVVVTSNYNTNVLTNVIASGGGIVDTVAGTVTWNLGNLDAGDLAALTINADVVDPVAAGIDDFITTATISDDGSNGPDPTPLNNQDSDTDTLNAAPDYQVTIDDGITNAAPGDTLTYSVTARNIGTQDGTGVVLVSSYDTSVLTSVTASGGGIVDTVAGTVTWNLGAFNAGDLANLTVTGDVLTSVAAGIDDFTTTATINDDGSNGPDPTPADNSDDDTDTLDAAPDYQVTIDDGVTNAAPGDTLTYNVTARNVGTQDGTGVALVSSYDTNVLTSVSASGGGIVDAVAGTVTWNVGAFNTGDLANFTVTGDVLASITAGIDDFTTTATVTDDGNNGPDPTPADNSDDDVDTLVAAPDYEITINDGRAVVSTGDTLTYTITAQNVGNQDGTGVVITDAFPTSVLTNVTASLGGVVDTVAGTVTWNTGALAVGDFVVVTVTADILDPLAAGIDDLTSTANVSDDGTNGPDPTPANNTDDDTDTVVAAPDYQITIDDGLTVTSPGSSLVYTLSAENVGDQGGTGVVVISNYDTNVLTNVTASGGGIVDTVAGTVTWNLGNLDAGDLATLSIDADVADPLAAGVTSFLTTAGITDDGANGPDPTPGNNTDDDTDTLVAAPDYQITIDDGQAVSPAGSSLVYTLSAENVGDQDGTGVVVTSSYDTNVLTNVSASGGGIVDTVAGTVTWNLGNLDAGDLATLTIDADVLDPLAAGIDDFMTTATISDDGSNGPDPTPPNNQDSDTDTLDAAPDYQVTIDDGLTDAAPGDTMTYDVTATNVGTQDGTGVVVTSSYDTNVLTNVTASGGGIVDAVAGTVTWNLGNLDAGDLATLTIDADVLDPLAAGIDDFTTTAAVSDDGNNGPDPTPANNSDNDVDTLDAAPDYQITIDDGQGLVSTGDTLTYTITAENVGDQDGTGVVVNSSYNTNVLTNVTASGGGIVDTIAGTVTWSLGNLHAGDLAALSIDADVIDPLAAGIDDMTTTASITDDGTNGPDPTPANNADDDIDTLDAAPDYQITIDDGQIVSPAGSSLVYTLSAENVGDQDGTGVVVISNYDTNVLTNVTASGGGIVDAVAGTVTWNLGNLDAGDLTNLTINADVLDPVAATIPSFTTTATISDDGSNGPDPTPLNNQDSDTDTLTAVPDYQVTIDDGLTNAAPGDTLTYTVTARNVGTQDGTGVALVSSYDTNVLTNVTASGGGIVDPVAGTVTWNLGAFNVGDLANFTVTGDVLTSLTAGIDDFTTTATITDDGSNGPDPTPADNSDDDVDTLVAVPDYQITIDDGVTSVSPGDSVTYTVDADNIGSQGGTGVVVTSSYDTNILTNVTASGGGIVDTVAGTITWNVGALGSGGSRSFTVTSDVAATVAAGLNSVTTTAGVTDDGNNGPDPTPANNSDNDVDTLVAVPDYQITIDDGQGVVSTGDTLTYTITAQNLGDQDGTGVVVTSGYDTNVLTNVTASGGGIVDTIAGTVTWNTGALAGGDVVVVTVIADVIDPAAAGISNFNTSANITDDGANGPDPTPANNTDNDIDTLNAAPDYQITIDDGQIVSPAGTSLVYTLSAENAGDQDGTGVVVTSNYDTNVLTNVTASGGGMIDAVAGTVTWNLGNLDAGDLTNLTINADVLDPVAATIPSFTTTATISDDGSNGPDPTPLNNQDSDTDALTAVPDYQVTIDDGLTNAAPGDTLTYTVTARNVGTQDGTGVFLVSSYDTNVLTNVTSSGGGIVDPVAGTVTWNLGAFNVGDLANYTVTGDVLTSLDAGIDDFTTTATITDDGSNGPDPTPADNSDDDVNTLVAVPDYQITIDNGVTSVSPGDSVTYTVNVNNVGSQGGTGIVVTTSYPNQLLTNVVASHGGIVDTVAGTITWNVATLGSGGNLSFTVTGDVFATVAGGLDTLTTTSHVSDDGSNGIDPNPANNVDDDFDTLVAAPDYQITIDDGQAVVSPGDTPSYTVTIQNVGNQDGTGVVVTGSYLTSVFTVVSASDGGLVNPTTGTVVWNSPSLSAGGTRTLTLTGEVAGTIPAFIETMPKLADVTDDGTNGLDPTPFNNVDDDTNLLAATPDLTLAKSDGNVVTVPSGNVAYTLDYSNVGNQDASGVVLDESLPAGTQFDPAHSTPGWTHLGSGNYRFVVGHVAAGSSGQVQFGVQQVDIFAAGLFVTNTATITDDGAGGVDPTPGNNTSTEQTPIAAGSISGYSYVDTNGNGAVDAGEPAIANVSVHLDGTDVYGNNLTATTVTDASGYYEFRDLPPGLFTIRQQQPADYDDGIDSTQTAGAVVSGNDEIMVPLQPGQMALANNFGEAGLRVDLLSKRHLLTSGTDAGDLLSPPPARQRMSLDFPTSASGSGDGGASQPPAGDPGPTSLRAPEANPVRMAAIRLIPPISTRPAAPEPALAVVPETTAPQQTVETVPLTTPRRAQSVSLLPAARVQPLVSNQWVQDPLWRRVDHVSHWQWKPFEDAKDSDDSQDASEAPAYYRDDPPAIEDATLPWQQWWSALAEAIRQLVTATLGS